MTKKFGMGTVLAFESFVDNGRKSTLTYTDNGGRIVVKLDDPSRWILASHTQPHPYMFRSDLP